MYTAAMHVVRNKKSFKNATNLFDPSYSTKAPWEASGLKDSTLLTGQIEKLIFRCFVTCDAELNNVLIIRTLFIMRGMVFKQKRVKCKCIGSKKERQYEILLCRVGRVGKIKKVIDLYSRFLANNTIFNTTLHDVIEKSKIWVVCGVRKFIASNRGEKIIGCNRS